MQVIQSSKKSHGDSFRFPDAKQFEIDQVNNRLFLPKLGWIRYRNSRPILGEAKNITISEKADKWFVSIQTEREVEIGKPSQSDSLPCQATNLNSLATSSVGCDAGIARLLTLSDDTVYEPLNVFKKFQLKLAKAQMKAQRIYRDIANARKDYLHKISTTISKNHAMVFIEDLQIMDMSNSAAGTTDKPGKKVKQKSGLNKAILDQGLGMLFSQLDYKLSWSGGWLVKVPPHTTSRMCPWCAGMRIMRIW